VCGARVPPVACDHPKRNGRQERIMAQREARIRLDSKAADFRIETLSGEEELSRSFVLRLTLLHPKHGVSLQKLLGTRATVDIDTQQGGKRYLDGFIADASYLGVAGTDARYGITLMPWLWFLSRRRDCRIFQNETVPEIVTKVFGRYPMADYASRLVEHYEPRVYCVQYRESDLDFVCRLLEDEGIYFYFEHKDGGHKLILVDQASAHKSMPGYASVPYFPPDVQARRERDSLDHWRANARVLAGRATLRDFDFEKPRAELTALDNQPKAHQQADNEVYDYPGGYVELNRGDRLARTRLEELQAEYLRSTGGGTATGLACGARFKLENFPRTDQNIDWLVVKIRHELEVEPPRSGQEATAPEPYRCWIEVQDLKLPFRPARITPRPVVRGPQTAIVTGTAGEEIYTDKYARVKVQFHWDREGKNDQNSSCWIRVSQVWAGSAWGAIHIPRIGQEVIVDFLEGDPDQPIITGRVYNAAAMPPYVLPANATQSGIKSNSSKGGGGSNELRFEDRKGGEEVYVHAQKDETIVVEHDKTETVHHDERITIDNDRTELVGHDETMTVGNDRTRNVGVNEQVTIGANQTITVGIARVDSVGAMETRTVGAARIDTVGAEEVRTVGAQQVQTVGDTRTVTVGAAQSHDIGADDSWTVANNRSVSVGGDRSADVTGNDSISIGQDRSLNVGQNLIIEAGDSIVIKTGSASIAMKKDGTITIDGKDITVTGSGKITHKADGDIVQKGQKILQN
jgi:type VI secretion system secreted protein VgrG